jgi:hypothetical protein
MEMDVGGTLFSEIVPGQQARARLIAETSPAEGD